MENNRNYLIAIALSVMVVLGWQFFYMNPRIEAQRQAEQAQQAQQAKTPASQATPGAAVNGALPGQTQASATTSREDAVAKSARVEINTEALSGSINLTGARLDDLRLKGYHETVDKTSPIITLLNPADTKDGYFAEIGFIGGEKSGSVPGPSTVWTVKDGQTLTETTPVTLTYTNETGLTFSRKISVDKHYMFTIEDTVANGGALTLALPPMAVLPATTSQPLPRPMCCMKALSA